MRRRLDAARTDEGVTLVEFMVAAFLSLLIMVAICSMFIVVAKQTVASQGTRLSTADASNIVNVVSTTIRASINNAVQSSDTPDPAIVSATSSAVVVISYTDAGPSFETPLQIRYQIVGGRMTEDRWKPSIVKGYAVFPAVTTTHIRPAPSATWSSTLRWSRSSGTTMHAGTELVPGAVGLTLAQRQATTSFNFDVKVLANNSQRGGRGAEQRRDAEHGPLTERQLTRDPTLYEATSPLR